MNSYRDWVPNFETAQDYINYLRNTLIPDLRDSGFDATADDFEEAIYWIELLRHPQYHSLGH